MKHFVAFRRFFPEPTTQSNLFYDFNYFPNENVLLNSVSFFLKIPSEIGKPDAIMSNSND